MSFCSAVVEYVEWWGDDGWSAVEDVMPLMPRSSR